MLYNVVLLLGALYAIPKWLLQKKYRGTVLQRMGWKLPAPSPKKPVIWFHMVSMGETKAMATIYQALVQKYPEAAFYISSTTATGHAEAKRSLKNAACYFFLPLDFSWTMKQLVKRISPDLLIISEGDFWANQINSVKNGGGRVVVLNGKISEKSASLFSKVPTFTKRLFGASDYFCVQNEEYAARFAALKIPREKISITGNLKLAIPTPKLTPSERAHWQNHFGIDPQDQVITLGSTHENEERLLLEQLKHLETWKILVVPRHPERFPVVKKFLAEINNPNLILVDQMGVLSKCYQLSNIAIVGGSFIPGVGGHNIFEPVQAHVPVIFGPYMHTQKELVQMILGAKAGIQTPLEQFPEAIKNISALANNAKELATAGEKVHEITWEQLNKYLP